MSFDPRSRSAASWKAKLAALSRSVPLDDPSLDECRAALEWHKYKRLTESTVAAGLMSASLAEKFLDALRQQPTAVRRAVTTP